MTAPDPRGETWSADEIARLVAWGKITRMPPYELLVEQFPGRTVQALRNKLHRLKREGRLCGPSRAT